MFEGMELSDFFDEKGVKKLIDKMIRFGTLPIFVEHVERKKDKIHIQLLNYGPADKIIFCLGNNQYYLVKGDMISITPHSEPIYVYDS